MAVGRAGHNTGRDDRDVRNARDFAGGADVEPGAGDRLDHDRRRLRRAARLPDSGGRQAPVRAKCCFIRHPSLTSLSRTESSPTQWLFAERPECDGRWLSAAAKHQPIDSRMRKAPTIAAMKPAPSPCVVPADRLAEEAGEQRAGDAEQDGDDAAARVLARHQQLGDRRRRAGRSRSSRGSRNSPSSASSFRRACALHPPRSFHARCANALRRSSAAVGRKSLLQSNAAGSVAPSDLFA